MEARIKTQVMTFFKFSGFHLRSEVAMLLVEKIKELDEQERKQFIDKIFTSIQNQTLETSSIEKEHMTAAIRVSCDWSFDNTFVHYAVIFRNHVTADSTTNPKQFSVSSMQLMFPPIST